MTFRMGRLDHVHIRVPDRAVAARWYREHLGFEPVGEFDFWAKGFPGGPLQISADGGRTMLAQRTAAVQTIANAVEPAISTNEP